jgi:hypothetical protein
MRDEKQKRELELIGERFKFAYPETYALIEREFNCDSAYLVATQLEEYFPVTFQQMREETEDEFEGWVEQYEASLDPPMDEFDYLRPQI